MRIGLIGLGKMGFNLSLNILENGHELVAYNRTRDKVDEIKKFGAIPSYSIQEFLENLGRKRIIWMMVTAGKPVDEVLASILPHLSKGDIIIDGGNSFYKDSQRRAMEVRKKGIMYLDIGTSGGISGARHGACAMVGGDEPSFREIEPFLKDICVKDGYGYFGKSGSGHFVKMVHNGIEYGMMQAIGEGLEVIEKSEFAIDKARLTRVWNHGSIIRGYLMELLNNAYAKDLKLSSYSGAVGLSGEGEWTVNTAKELDVPAPAINAAVGMRMRSIQEKRYQGKVVQALRFEFGGHEEPKK